MEKYIQNNLRIRRKQMGYTISQVAFLLGGWLVLRLAFLFITHN